MPPIDPAKPVPPDRRASSAPPYVDEDPNLASVQQGLTAAEDELRDTVADAYEENAAGDEEKLDDIDYTEAEDTEAAPEVKAMRREPGD